MNMVLPTPRYVRPTLVVTGADALLLAPYALPLDFLVEIKLHVFYLVTLVEVSAARVEIQIILLAVVHKAKIIFLATITYKEPGMVDQHFHNVNSYRYAMATIIIGAAFNLFQIALALYRLVTKTDDNILFNFYGDKILSYLLLLGAAATLGDGVDFVSMFDWGNAAAALFLLSFFCSAVVSVYFLAKFIPQTLFLLFLSILFDSGVIMINDL